MYSEKETYLRRIAEQRGLSIELLAMTDDACTAFNTDWKMPKVVVYFQGTGYDGVAVLYEQLQEPDENVEGYNPFLPEFLPPSPENAIIVDMTGLPSDISFDEFNKTFDDNTANSESRPLVDSGFMSVYLDKALYTIPQCKEGFCLVCVADLLEEINPKLVDATYTQKYVFQTEKERNPFNSTLTALDCRVKDDDPFLGVLDGVDQPAYEINEDCLVYEHGNVLPFYFKADKGKGIVSKDSIVWRIKENRVLPQYLMIQLYEDYALRQYFVNGRDLRIGKGGPFTHTFIYIPQGDEDFSLYEQRRIYVEKRAEAIEAFARKNGALFANDYQLSPTALLQNGKYQILEHIDNGGFGKVYKASYKQGCVRRTVALKELFVREYCRRKEFSEMVMVASANEKDYERQKSKFVDEYNILYKVGKKTKYVPELVSEVFDENNTKYYAMQFIDNGTIWDHRDDREVKVQDMLRLICHAGIALHHAHDLDYLHLDVSPLNIMVDNDGKGILIDFGNSKHYSVEENKFTSVGNAAHTRCFAPPELMQQVVGQYYMEMDVYSLAMTLFSVLTTMVPRYRSVGDNHEAYINDSLTKYSISDNIQRAIVKATQYEVNDRYPTIRDFLLDLLPAIDDEELCKEIKTLQPVTGFDIDRHKVSPDDTSKADYIPLSE